MTKVYDNATDLITFARSSSGTALRRVGYGPELVTNGDFATGDLTGWSVIGSDATHSVTYSSGGARYQSDTTSPVLFFSGGAILEIGKLYQITVETTAYTSGSLKTDSFSGSKVLSTGLGTVTINAVASSDSFVIVRNSSNVDITIDNISVKEVIFDRATDPLVLFDHPDDTPRIEYAADGSLKGLLIEEARTNLFPSSNDFTTWAENTTSGATTGLRYIQANVATGPDGQTSAHKLVESTDYDQQRIYYAFSGLTASTDYTYSVFLKAGERTEAYVRTTGTSGMLVDLSDGTFVVNGGSNHDVQHVGNGWYRCSFTVNEPGTLVVPWVSISSGSNDTYTGDGTSGVYIYGFQLEEGSFPTSYIPTSGSQSTRSPDIASIPVSAFGYNQDAGTVVVEFSKMYPYAVYSRFHAGFGANNTNYVGVGYGYGQAAYVQPLVGSIIVSGASAPSPGEFAIVAASFDASGATSAVDGQSKNQTATGSAPALSQSDTLYLGTSPFSLSSRGSGHIKSLKYFPRRLTDAQLQELTS